MTRLTDVFPGLKVTPVIGILRGLGSEEAEMAAGLALEAGIPLIEVTLDTEGAFDQIKRLTDRGVTTGAGSVLTENAAERAFSVGAAFIITPAVVPQLSGPAQRLRSPASPERPHRPKSRWPSTWVLLPSRFFRPTCLEVRPTCGLSAGRCMIHR